MLQSRPSLPILLRWTARITGLLVFLFWGAFFVEHVSEWFSDPSNLPPAKVFLGQAFHGLMLVSLLAAWKWELPGALMIILFAGLFFLKIIGLNGIVFFLVTIIPAILYLITWKLTRNAGSSTAGAA